MCADFECELVELNGEAEHAHLLVNFPPTVALTRRCSDVSTDRRVGEILPHGNRRAESDPEYAAESRRPRMA
ncbi:transposase [Micromonospora sp. NPDC049460]|uniref:transposase n=1 Tax=unclassified Micromonospora TaxID=2617518 RepID=UPI00371182A7